MHIYACFTTYSVYLNGMLPFCCTAESGLGKTNSVCLLDKKLSNFACPGQVFLILLTEDFLGLMKSDLSSRKVNLSWMT